MLNRISRVLCYLQEFLRMLFFRPISFFCRSFFPSYRNIWLVSERGNDARDNGYWFYHYLRTEHPEIHSFYVISPDSMDAPKIVALGGPLAQGSVPNADVIKLEDHVQLLAVQPRILGGVFHRGTGSLAHRHNVVF